MKRDLKAVLVSILIFLIASLIGFAEVIVIDKDSMILFPVETLKPNLRIDEASFLLDRSDMEAAALAMETIYIKDDEITKLTQSWNNLLILTIGIPVLTLISGLLIGSLLK